ncbi:unnamed protein product [Adineta steineri]|uniref:ATP-dependent RNA helicase DHX34 n=2 Tax=Adineta steineri TaxID=433720 RepID=A0A814VNU5_9BILA|nr:unnamed protein product [Adineta steineri]
MSEQLNELEQQLGYYFNDRNHLRRALTCESAINERHSDAADENSKALAFIGDAALKSTIATLLYANQNQRSSAGDMHNQVVPYIENTKLASIGRQLNLDRYMIKGTGVRDVTDSMFATTLEAILGAIVIDQKNKEQGSEDVLLDIIARFWSIQRKGKSKVILPIQQNHNKDKCCCCNACCKYFGIITDDADDDKHRKHHRSKTTTDQSVEEPTTDPNFDWLNRKDYLTETFLHDNIMFSSLTDIEDFWKFVYKYQLFQQKRKQPPKPTPSSIDTDQQRSSILNLPLIYEKRHRLNASITINKSLTHAEPRYDMMGERIIEHHRLSSGMSLIEQGSEDVLLDIIARFWSIQRKGKSKVIPPIQQNHNKDKCCCCNACCKYFGIITDDADDDKHRKHHRSKTTTDQSVEEPTVDPNFDWLNRKDYLTETFLHDNIMFSSLPDIEDFWKFVHKYQLFQQKRKQPSKPTPSSIDTDQQRSSILNLPLIYEKRHRLNASITINKSLTHAEPRYDMMGERIIEHHRLSSIRLEEFKSIIEYYFDFNQKEKFKRIHKLRQDQNNLPIAIHRREILEELKNHQVILIAGDTGCGKSTQIPRFLLEAGFDKIACTQPRRIACISLAKRVSYETLNEYDNQVGYQVRFEKTRVKSTRIIFMTEGILLRQLQTDSSLSDYDILVIDEVHERHLFTDFIMGIIKCLITQRKDLKVILMSATINIELFSKYFDDCPVVKVPGRLYKIQVNYHPIKVEESAGKTAKIDAKPYLRIMEQIDLKYPSTDRGDMLIFLSGMAEIQGIMEAAQAYAQENLRWIVLPLHSALSLEEQDKVFDMAPEGVRKCIISTNIAETSVTIDGMRFIIDSGKVKEMSYDGKYKMQRLQEYNISRASAEQRKGRAGRTGPGVCFRLYSEHDYLSFQEYSTPEIRRVPLDSLMLQMISMGLKDPRKFPFVEPPDMAAIDTALLRLQEQAALSTIDCSLTSIGSMLARLPVDVSIGKMLIFACIFQYVNPILIMASALSIQSPFLSFLQCDPDTITRRRPMMSDHGDPFTLLNLFDEWIYVKSDGQNTRTWCKRRGVEEQRLYDITKLRRQFQDILRDYNMEIDYKQNKARTTLEKREHWRKKQQLKDLRSEHDKESKQRKFLKLEESSMTDDHGDDNVKKEVLKTTDKIRDIEFRLINDLSVLKDMSTDSQNYRSKDINMLKLILCSGLYPQVAIADEFNNYKRDCDQFFHTKTKQFVVLHPTSVFTYDPDNLLPPTSSKTVTSSNNKKQVFSNKHELLVYVTLIETNKPYIMSVMRTPSMQTLFLYASTLETNNDFTRILCDQWLEITFENAEAAQSIISSLLLLRNARDLLLQLTLQDLNKSIDIELVSKPRTYELQHLLSLKMTEFLDNSCLYAIRRVLPAELDTIYRYNTQVDDDEVIVEKESTKINEYLTYNCLRSNDDQESFWSEYAGATMQKHWICPYCNEDILATVAERVAHENRCQLNSLCNDDNPIFKSTQTNNNKNDILNNLTAITHTTSTIIPTTKDYHCDICQQTFKLTSIEILRHRATHQN